MHVNVLRSGAVQVANGALVNPEKAMLADPARGIGHEFPLVTGSTLDFDLPQARGRVRPELSGFVTPVLEELLSPAAAAEAAARGPKRFEMTWRPPPLEAPEVGAAQLKDAGDVLITGGFGGIGLTLARRLIEAALGPVNGIIHAAAVLEDGLIQTRTMTGIEDVLAPKLHGIRVQAVGWGIWADTGMAADAMAHGTGDAVEAPVLPTHQLRLDHKSFDRAGHRVVTADHRLSDRWVLDAHRTPAGDALQLGTGYLELAAGLCRARCWATWPR